MDILEAYEKQNPQPIRAAPQRQLTDEYGFFIRLVMRLSGGKIENTRQASMVLLAVSGVIILVTVAVFFFSGGSSLPPSPPTPFQEAKQ